MLLQPTCPSCLATSSPLQDLLPHQDQAIAQALRCLGWQPTQSTNRNMSCPLLLQPT